MGCALVTTSRPVSALTATPSTPGSRATSLWTAASQCAHVIPLTRYSLVGMPLLFDTPLPSCLTIVPARALSAQVRSATGQAAHQT
jgi:hypothetical protein